MDNAGTGWHHLEVVKSGLSPTQELVALTVSFILNIDVACEGIWLPKKVGDDRVVDNKLGWREGVDLARIAAQINNCLAHSCQVNDAGNASEILQHHAGWGELDFCGWLRVGIPTAERADLVLGDVGTVFGAQQVLQQHFEAEGESLVALDAVRAVDLVVSAANV
ncbi:unannotated protein [freshwater metagenome]|uniref:Unannotated protein n=1 Tax=freshwater metagenome TaxID=449393 RepID=A0A6J6KPP9_9ZZZZ